VGKIRLIQKEPFLHDRKIFQSVLTLTKALKQNPDYGGRLSLLKSKGAIKYRQRFSPSGPFDKVCLVVPFYFIQKGGIFQKVIYMGDNLLYDEHNTGTGERKGTGK
jgi:hypothetical protein